MLHPTAQELSENNKWNRYEIALAAAKGARIITNEYVRQHDAAEKQLTGSKDTDKPLNTMIDKEFRDVKAVELAVEWMESGKFEVFINDEES
ncbi:MAG: hypothetical protein IJR83_03960 [Clostridia bacterium]|nr:hypothetical protein [Clostridia bacterium]